MKGSIFKFATISLVLAVNFSCGWKEEPQEEILPCDPKQLDKLYEDGLGIPPWVDKVIFEWLENGVYGRISKCDYVDGRGFLFEQFGNSIDDIVHSFRTCDGTALYDGEKNSIEATYPELNIKNQMLLIRKFPSWWWGQEETSDEFVCNVINPFTLPRMKEFTYRCEWRKCTKIVAICPYKDGVGFFLGEHLKGQPYCEFLDCSGNLLCKVDGYSSNLCPDLNIDFRKQKIILELYISLKFNYLNH